MKKIAIVIGIVSLLIMAFGWAGSGKIITDILEATTVTTTDLTATGTTDIALAGSNITAGIVAETRIASTIARDTEVNAAILENNNSVIDYVDAAQGGDVNKSYVDTRFTNNNATLINYIDTQDQGNIGNKTVEGFINYTSSIDTINYFNNDCVMKQNSSGVYFIC